MDIEILTRFFMWSTIIHVAIFALATMMMLIAPAFVYRMQNRWFLHLPRETFDAVMYGFLGLYKVLLLVFVVVPYIALLIIG